jgi:hypothetical protein
MSDQKKTDAQEASDKEAQARAKEVDAKTVKVRVNDDIAALGGAFTDPETKVTIGEEPVSVKRTAFVAQKLRNEELVEA